MTEVWLAEQSTSAPAEVLGIFSKPGKAVEACQGRANEYFGAERTPLLKWVGDDGYRSAYYHHPASGMYLFQITRYTVDQERDT